MNECLGALAQDGMFVSHSGCGVSISKMGVNQYHLSNTLCLSNSLCVCNSVCLCNSVCV